MVSRFWHLCIAGMVTVAVLPAGAHTARDRAVVCPICQTRSTTRMTMSMTTFGGYLDFQKRGAIGSYYESMVHSCPRCRYSAYQGSFEKPVSAALQARVRAFAQKPLSKIDHVEKFERAAQLFIWQKQPDQAIAQLYLVASYLLRGNVAHDGQRRRYQTLAADYFARALQGNSTAAKERPAVTYLIGDLHRRCGRFADAERWYARALAEPGAPAWLTRRIKQQSALAKRRDANNTI